MSSPLAALEATMNNPKSLFIPAPLPERSRDISLVMYKTIRVTVRGNHGIGERPYVKIGRWRYTNERIAHDYSLIGKELKAYCSIRDARVVLVTLVESGENLGRLVPPRRWAHTLVSFRDRALLFRAGSDQRRAERRSRGTDWIPPGRAIAAKEAKTSAKDALAIAKREIEQSSLDRGQEDVQPPDIVEAAPRPARAPRQNTLFNLDRLIDVDEIIMKE